jgi:putative endonuclease
VRNDPEERVTKGHSGCTGMAAWFTYILECADGSFYVGITNDLNLRVAEHNDGQGARWTAKRRPVKLRYAESHPSKSEARKREIEIKGWRRNKKIGLFESASNIAFGYTGTVPEGWN